MPQHTTDPETTLRLALAAYATAHTGRRLHTQRDVERTRELAAVLRRHAAFADRLADVSKDCASRPDATVLDLAALRAGRGAA